MQHQVSIDPDQFDRFDINLVYSHSFIQKGMELCSIRDLQVAMDFENTPGLIMLTNGGVWVTQKPGFVAVESRIGTAVRSHSMQQSVDSDYKEETRMGGGIIRNWTIAGAEVLGIWIYNECLASAGRDYSGIIFELEHLVDLKTHVQVEIAYAKSCVNPEGSQFTKRCQDIPDSSWEIIRKTSSRVTASHKGFSSLSSFYAELTNLIDWATCSGIIDRLTLRNL